MSYTLIGQINSRANTDWIRTHQTVFVYKAIPYCRNEPGPTGRGEVSWLAYTMQIAIARVSQPTACKYSLCSSPIAAQYSQKACRSLFRIESSQCSSMTEADDDIAFEKLSTIHFDLREGGY